LELGILETMNKNVSPCPLSAGDGEKSLTHWAVNHE
jgi:hypothetical protein